MFKSFLYYWVRITLSVVNRIFYRNIHMVGEENLPANKPVIIASTHTNSFLDGVMIMSLMERISYSLARGDAFLNPKFNRILRSMNLLPIFRATDADPRESVRRNNEMFDETYELLLKNRAIIIFSEAISVPGKKVRTVRKGTARMAADMMKRSNMELDLHVIPLGMNYGHFRGPRKSLTLKFGKAIKLSEYVEEIKNTEAKFVNHLTRTLQSEFEEQMVIAPDGQEDTFDELLQVAAGEHPVDPLMQFDRSEREFRFEKEIGETVIQEGNIALERTSSYVAKRNAVDLSEYKRYSSGQKWLRAIHFILTILPSLLTMILHGWIMPTAKKMTPKKIKTPVFFDSVYMGIILLGMYAAGLVFFPISFFIYGWGGVLIYWVLRWSLPAYFQNVEFLSNWTQKRKWKKLERNNPALFQDLDQMRKEILEASIPAKD